MKYIIVTLYFFLSQIVCVNSNAQPDTISFKGEMNISGKVFFMEAYVYGTFFLTHESILFSPKYNYQYLKRIEISFDSIEYVVNKPMKFLWIITKNGCEYRVAMNGKKELFKRINKFIDIRNEKHHRKTHDINFICKTQVEYVEVKIPFWGSTLYTPLKLYGHIEKVNENFIFEPLEYNCYFKNIYINENDIITIRKKCKQKVVLKLSSGDKYKFITKHKDELLNYFKNDN